MKTTENRVDNYMITASCNPYHASRYYCGERVIEYDCATPVKWVCASDLTEEAAHALLDAFADERLLERSVYYGSMDDVRDALSEMADAGLDTDSIALSFFKGAGYYTEIGGLAEYLIGDDELRYDALLSYKIEKNVLNMNKDDSIQKIREAEEFRVMCENATLRYEEEQAQKHELAEYLIEASHRYGDIKMRNYAVRLVGEKEVIVICLNKNLPLRDDDRRYIIEKLG